MLDVKLHGNEDKDFSDNTIFETMLESIQMKGSFESFQKSHNLS